MPIAAVPDSAADAKIRYSISETECRINNCSTQRGNMTKVFLKILLIIPVLLLTACNAPEHISPPFIILEKGNDQITIAGTVHFVSEQAGKEIQEAESSISGLIKESDAFFTEYGPLEFSDAMQDEYISLIRSSEERPSLEMYLQDFEPDRREAFMRNMNSFPLLENHVGRQKQFLEFRPFASSDYLEKEIIKPATGISTGPSIDNIYTLWSEQAGIPHYGLQGFLDSVRLYDAVNQELYVKGIEEILSINPTAAELREAYQRVMEVHLEVYRTGNVKFYSEKEIYKFFDYTDEEIDRLTSQTEITSAVLAKRERLWMDTLKTFLDDNNEPQNVFLAVGYAHLGKPGSILIAELIQDGWEIKQQSFKLVESEQDSRVSIQTHLHRISGVARNRKGDKRFPDFIH